MITPAIIKNNIKVAVIIPCFNEEKTIIDVVKEIPSFISEIILVDDKSHDNTFKIMKELSQKTSVIKITILQHEKNLGVGAAVKSGLEYAASQNHQIMVKIDGDGQMPSAKIFDLILPLVEGFADYTKGNRLSGTTSVASMPKIRLFGNLGLSFFIKMASGYWDVIDPTNGFIAIRKETYQLIKEQKISNGYFFESSMLCALGLFGAKVKDISMPSFYPHNKSSLSIAKTFFEFPPKIIRALIKRVLVRKILHTLSLEIIFVLIGSFLFFTGAAWGLYKYYYFNFILQIATPSGVVMLAALPIIFAHQMFLTALLLDVSNTPKQALFQKMDLE